MSITNSKEGAGWLASEIAEKFSSVFQSLTEDKLKVHMASAAEAQEAATTRLIWNQSLKGLEGASVQVCASESAWLEIGNRILEAAGLDPTPEESQSTFTEALTQAISALCQTFSSRLSREISLGSGTKSQSNGSAFEHDFILRVEPSAGASQDLFLRLSVDLNRALAPAVPAFDKPVSEARGKAKTFDLLLEVEMPVSVSFGRAQLPLKDVLKLTSGSIVELNRSISEPVEIIVNNCVIARGEVVVIEGNYGVRIAEIVNRQERLRTLK